MPRSLSIDFLRRRDLSHQELRNPSWHTDSNRCRIERNVSGLQTMSLLDEIFKDTIDAIENNLVAAKVGGEPAFDTILGFDNFFDHLEIGFNIGAAKSVNRLLRITDDEDFSGNYFDLAPVHRRLPGLFGQVEEDLILNRIRILKFVEENRAVTAFKIGPHPRLIPHQIACAHQQSIKREVAFANEPLAKIRRKRHEQAPEHA